MSPFPIPVVFALVFAMALATGCKSGRTAHGNSFTGILEARDWTKSGESYCAQGSGYFVLVDDNGQATVLEHSGKYAGEALNVWVGKPVKIAGERVTRKIEPPSNPMAQQPAEGGIYTCTVLKVLEIRAR